MICSVILKRGIPSSGEQILKSGDGLMDGSGDVSVAVEEGVIVFETSSKVGYKV